MQPGQAFGPFTLEKKLGAGAMGAVWRAIHTKTNKRVALKVMLPGLLDDNPGAAARFEREIEILKQLNHPHIVKLYGLDKSYRYYAMEYIEGESLDHLMARRERMSWEEVVTLGKQLCSALQHAHEKGVIHRDLKPSNLMILKDGSVKLTDFGIAKDTDVDVTQLTEANCTVGTASYMSPEQCRGERNLTYKSDLYSLGIVFYELVTGDKPFKADNAMAMFLLHVNGKVVRPGKKVLDLPVWFDNLICQLLEKKAEHRPVDAAMVASVLSTIEEKVQAQQSAGVEVATRKRSDRPRGAPERTEEDREIARTLAGKGKRKATAPPRFYQRWWFAAGGVLLVVGGMAAVLFLALWLWPRSSVDKLYARAKPLMESKNPDEDWPKALDSDNGGPLYLFERFHADEKGEQAEQLRQWLIAARKRECDKMVRKYVANKKKNLPYEAHGEVQENAFDAGLAEEDGDLKRAEERWKRVKETGTGGWTTLANERLQQLAALAGAQQVLEKHLDALRDPTYKPSLAGPQLELAQAQRYARFGDDWRAYQELELLREKYAKDPEQRFWFLFAARKVQELKPKPGASDSTTRRRELVAERLKKAESIQDSQLLDARLLYLEIAGLYGEEKDKDIQQSVLEANQGLKAIAAKLQ